MSRRDNQDKLKINKTAFSGTLSALIPVFVFIFLTAAYVFSSYINTLQPKIEALSPEVGLPGDFVEIAGRHFGEPEDFYDLEIRKPVGSSVYISGTRLVLSDYILWSDSRIVIRLPENITSGPLFVENNKGRSNDLLFINRNEIPVMLTGPVEPGMPYISSHKPAEGMIGREVTIQGLNFGMERESSHVYFTLASPATSARDTGELSAISAAEIDYDYVSWTDTEIRVRVPDGASTGTLWVKTDRGVSNSVYLEISQNAGTRSFEEKRIFQVSYDVTVNVIDAEPENSISLWIPSLMQYPEQRNIESETNISPVLDNYNGLMLYRFFNVPEGESRTVEVSAWFERYEVLNKINRNRVEWNYNKDSRFFIENTKDFLNIRLDDEKLEQIIRRIANARDPFTRANNIYKYLGRMKFDPYVVSNNVIENFENLTGDSYTFAMIFTALARKAGIPSRPVSGFYVLDNKTAVKHFWSEIFIENYGWIPVDPALGHGGDYGNIILIDNPEEFFFGNLDNRHITFSKGVIPVPNISPSGRTVFRDKMYSLQTVYEETTGNIDNLIIEWSNLKINEWW